MNEWCDDDDDILIKCDNHFDDGDWYEMRWQ